MVIPERTRSVHKLVVPFFLVKLGVVLFSLSFIFLVVIGIDYVHVLGRMAENKRLKGENFKLRQDIQQIRNKVDSMESNLERVRNYAKKLQLLTGESKSGKSSVGEESWDRLPASREGKDRRSRLLNSPEEVPMLQAPVPSGDTSLTLNDRMERLQRVSTSTEASLSQLQTVVLTKAAILAATPSLVPINGRISSPFGYRRHPYDGSYRLHAGVDIAADPGTPVRAPADGLVIFSGYREGYGKVLVIDHGYGINTLFGHLSKTFVNAGYRVKRGEKISEVGNTGLSTGPHLHYEVRRNGVPIKPDSFFTSVRF